MIVFDTTVLIDILRGVPAARGYLESVDTVPVCSEITRAELLRGMRRAEQRSTEDLMSGFRWLPVDEAVARRAGALGRHYLRTHGNLTLGDLLIAATAQEIGAELATSNVRHFPMFPRLRPPY